MFDHSTGMDECGNCLNGSTPGDRVCSKLRLVSDTSVPATGKFNIVIEGSKIDKMNMADCTLVNVNGDRYDFVILYRNYLHTCL